MTGNESFAIMNCTISPADAARRLARRLGMLLALAGATPLFAAPGLYDTSFNGTGIARIDFGTNYDIVRAVAVQPDGKIVSVGSCGKTAGAAAARNICIARTNASGSLDTGFAGSGVVQITNSGDNYASGVAITPGGDILVSGTCQSSFCAYKLSASGGLYTNFGTYSPSGGRVMFAPSGLVMAARSLLLQADGAFVIGGSCFNSTGAESICLARFDGNGNLDNGFGAAGAGVQLGFFTGQILRLGGLALQGDGKIVYGGSLNPGSRFYVIRGRVNANGSFDGGFSTATIAPTGASNALGTGVALQADGKLLIGGYCTVTSMQRFCVTRVLGSDGSVDTGYGSGGFYIAPTTVLGGGTGEAIVAQPDGKAILSGTWNGNFAAIRLNDDGTLDPMWAGSGYTYGATSGGDQLYASALQRDGKLVWAGQCTPSGLDPAFCLQRLDGGPYDASQCVPDIDDDGRVLGPTDMLILSRVQQGLSGSAVLGGINFAPTATRTTWPAIRQYLVVHCGLTVQ